MIRNTITRNRITDQPSHLPQKNSVKEQLNIVLRNYQVYLLLLPALIFFIVFHYGPMYGVQIAFKDYNTGLGIWKSPWVGLKHFKRFIEMPQFLSALKNTLFISMASLLLGFPFPVLLALMLNEVKSSKIKKVVQTVTYAPHFISTVVIASMITLFLSPTAGFINKLIELTGNDPINFMMRPSYFLPIYVISEIWQHTGWASIIYLASLANVEQEQHESAVIDGATRLQRVWYINIPCILPTVVVLFILQAGSVLNVSFEKVFLLQNPSILEAADVISTYTYRIGIQGSQFSLSSAIGLSNSVANFVMLLLVNTISRRLGETSLW